MLKAVGKPSGDGNLRQALGRQDRRLRGSFTTGMLGTALVVLTLASLGGTRSVPAAEVEKKAAQVEKKAEIGEVPILRLSLDEAVAVFLKQNLDLLITKFGIDYAKGQRITAGLFPNPTL